MSPGPSVKFGRRQGERERWLSLQAVYLAPLGPASNQCSPRPSGDQEAVLGSHRVNLLQGEGRVPLRSDTSPGGSLLVPDALAEVLGEWRGVRRHMGDWAEGPRPCPHPCLLLIFCASRSRSKPVLKKPLWADPVRLLPTVCPSENQLLFDRRVVYLPTAPRQGSYMGTKESLIKE